MSSELLSANEMRACESAVIQGGSTSGFALMERAGRAVVAEIFAHWPEFGQAVGRGGQDLGQDETRAAPRHRALVLAGPGLNGGDGFIIATDLKARGFAVDLALYGALSALPADAARAAQLWQEAGGICLDVGQISAGGAACYDLLIDALFGLGLSRGVDLPLGAVSKACARVVAVDLPSGLCSDSGRVIGDEVMTAHLTVTFHARKLGHVLAEGPRHCGVLRVVDLGLSTAPIKGHESRPLPFEVTARPQAFAKGQGHKYGYGHALVLGGGPGRGGAGRLAARGALRVGAGLLTLAVPQEAMAENAARLDAIMLRGFGTAAELQAILQEEKLSALCIGPALGLAPPQAEVLRAALLRALPMVCDADAITHLARDSQLRGLLHENIVLTPHDGEFARLFPEIAARLKTPAKKGPAYSRLDAARDAAAALGVVVLLKGPDTVIAAPDGRAAVNLAAYGRAAPWLATAGSGDVLAGLICGLLARGLAPFDAAAQGAWLHVEAARAFGAGLIAEDLPEMLPQVFFRLGL